MMGGLIGYKGFVCTGDHAAKVAYMISCAEAVIAKRYGNPKIDRYNLRKMVGEVLAEYCDGALSIDEAVAELNAVSAL